MALRRGYWNFSLAFIPIIVSVTFLSQINFGSCEDEGNLIPNADTELLAPPKNQSVSMKHKLFEASLDGIDLSIIPGYREDDDFDNWIPPMEIQRDIPSYLSGFDNSSRPIWVLELGRLNTAKYVRRGKNGQELLLKYIRYLAYIGLKSHSLRSTAENPVTGHVKIFDHEGFKPEVFTDFRVYNFMKTVSASYIPYYEKYVHKIIHINVNFLGELWLNLQKRLRGPRYSLAKGDQEVYGTNKYLWGPKLAKSFPVNQLPEWYGGTRGFKPVYVIG